MESQTNEQALEASIERALAGISREVLKEQAGSGDAVALKQSEQYRTETPAMATSLSEATDVNVLHELKDSLDDVGAYDWHEVEQFNSLYFSNAPAEELSPIIDTCADRLDSELELEDEQKADFKIKAKQFVKICAQVACIMSFDRAFDASIARLLAQSGGFINQMLLDVRD